MARGGGADRQLGGSAVEYALMMAAIAVVIVVAVNTLGGALQTVFASTGAALDGSLVDRGSPAVVEPTVEDVAEPTRPGSSDPGPPSRAPSSGGTVGPPVWTPPGGGAIVRPRGRP